MRKRKHAKAIVFVNSVDPLNSAMQHYLRQTYPGFEVIVLDKPALAETSFARINPHLFVIPGNTFQDAFDGSRASYAVINKYLAGGGNILAICNGVYRMLDTHAEFLVGVEKPYCERCAPRVAIHGGATVHWEKDNEATKNPHHMYRSVATQDGNGFDILYMNGPYMKRAFAADKNAVPVLRTFTMRGTPSSLFAWMTATRLAGGGIAVLSGVHFEVPLSVYIEMCGAWAANFAATPGREKGVARALREQAKAQAVYDKYLKYYNKENDRHRDHVYEDLLGLER